MLPAVRSPRSLSPATLPASPRSPASSPAFSAHLETHAASLSSPNSPSSLPDRLTTPEPPPKRRLSPSAFDESLFKERLVPPHARTWWLFKDETPASSPSESHIRNAVHFAQINSHFTLDFMTNHPDRLQSLLGNRTPQNIQVKPLDYSFAQDFPLAAKVTKAAVSEIPQLSKDILSYASLRDQPGVSFDLDTEWHSSLPNPFIVFEKATTHIEGDANSDWGYENAIIAYPQDADDMMGDVMARIERNIPEVFSMHTVPDTGKTVFLPKTSQLNKTDNLVNDTQFRSYEKIMTENKVGLLPDYADYSTPDSSYTADNGTVFFLQD